MDTLNPVLYRRCLQASSRALQRYFGTAPKLAIVFGSGLGKDFLQHFPKAKRMAFAKIPHWSPPHVEGHSGEIFQITTGDGVRVLALSGRIHYYEGHSPAHVVLPLRSLAVWGVKQLLLTNAAGSMRKGLPAGSLAIISDHINLTGHNPLRGPNLDFLGPRFPSLARVYDNGLARQLLRVAGSLKIRLPKAVYVGIAGPSYETDAEVCAFQRLGGDLVGMSTVYEAIAAAHAGLEVAALSAVTNSCLRVTSPMGHESVLKNAKIIDRRLGRLLMAFLQHREANHG